MTAAFFHSALTRASDGTSVRAPTVDSRLFLCVLLESSIASTLKQIWDSLCFNAEQLNKTPKYGANSLNPLYLM